VVFAKKEVWRFAQYVRAYPCEKIEAFAKSESTPPLIHDGKRLNEIGQEQWIQE